MNPTILDPALLRRLAAEHIRVQGALEQWSLVPKDWLDDYKITRGKIADQLHASLVDYYNIRHDAGMALAAQHKETADALNQAADDIEKADQEGGAAIQNLGLGDHGTTPRHPAPTTPGHPVQPPGPVTTGGPEHPVAQHHPVSGPPPSAGVPTGAPHEPGATPDAGGPAQARPSAPLDAGPVVQHETPALGQVPPGGVVGQQSWPGSVPGIAPDIAGPPGGGPVPSLPGGPLAAGPSVGDVPAMVDPYANAVAPGAADGTATADATVDADSDLALAKALLGAVLAAAESPVGLEWAVSAMRGPFGLRLFLTSTEGRGWLPAGLHVPRSVSMPWQWDELLGSGRTSAWEGIADPARVLAEFGLVWGPRVQGRVTAVASSAPIDSGLEQGLGDAAVAGLVGPAYDHDLRVATAGSVDRLGLTGTPQALDSVAAVADSMVAPVLQALAADAHAAVGGAVSTPAEARPARVLREQILTTLQAGMAVPRQLWDDLRSLDELLAAAMLSRRVDAGRVDLGALTADEGSEVLRAMVFERRCTELALLLAGEPDQQSLRDAMYAHQQIAAHPQFAPAEAGATTEIAAPGGTSVAPATAGGPPGGVSVAPAADRAPRPAPTGAVVPPTISVAPAGVSAPATDLPPAVVPRQH
ncbi:type VII secretion target [Nocardia stercoris]|uniref:Uncharacterized protein n=1 Tax=Nocardia stercoris TaxID=2483361 RepID=A0A3M2KWW3_9NOCA|nr:type VII secretion target [Nocardia stercoris]RMI29534.1 hypothetical protein EBN03_26050 [Nocardia stercoris]